MNKKQVTYIISADPSVHIIRQVLQDNDGVTEIILKVDYDVQ